MNRVLIGLSVLLCSCAGPEPINVVLIIVDDLGWKDLSVSGSELYQTPRIDALASDGIRFDRFYADSPVCSPTRAALMTGKYPARLNITNWIGGSLKGQLIGAEYEHQLPLEEVTVAERFRDAGYRTGFIGKWHLGSDGFHPQDQGFELNVGGHDAGQPASYFWPYSREGGSRWDVPDLMEGTEGEYLTDRLTTEAISFIENNANRPFFLVLAHYAVHSPIQAKRNMVDDVAVRLAQEPTCPENVFEDDPIWSTTRTCQDDPTYAAMVQSTDESVGALLDALERLNLEEHTAIVFVSDNGGLSTLRRGRENAPTSNRPLRAGKGYLYEGGIRVPFIIKDPSSKEVGIRNQLASTIDVVPTLLDLAGLDIGELDGRSLLPVSEEADDLGKRPLFFHFPHYHGSGNRPSGAIIAGRFKLIEWFETGATELYDLERDQGELADLSNALPAIADSLLKMMQDWRLEVGANMPTPNPEWSLD